MPVSTSYSLWLKPDGDIAYRLQQRIKKLSKKYETPLFEPHVTLLGGLQASRTELISLTNTLATSLKPFKLELTKAGYNKEFYQALFVHIKKSNTLKKVHGMACQLFDLPQTNKFMPHLSLLYGDISRNEKERILNILGREFYLTFSVKSIVLMQTEGTPDQWKRIQAAVF